MGGISLTIHGFKDHRHRPCVAGVAADKEASADRANADDEIAAHADLSLSFDLLSMSQPLLWSSFRRAWSGEFAAVQVSR